MKIYITHLVQILNFSSPFRRSEIKNVFRRSTMVADNISKLVAPPQNFFHFYGPDNHHYKEISFIFSISVSMARPRSIHVVYL